MAAKKTQIPNKPQPTITAIKAEIPTKNLIPRLTWILIGIALFVFANTLTNGFVLDDIAVIENNKIVQQGLAGIPKLFTTFYWEGYWDTNAGLYRPLSLITFAIEWSISPNNPFIHHFVQIVLYALSIGLLFRVLQRVLSNYTIWLPFAVTLIFAVHPIHTEVVANIKSRDEILCFLFFLLTFQTLLTKDMTRWANRLMAAGFFLLCLLAKEAGILFLPIIGLYYVLIKRESIRNTLFTLIPLIATGSVWLAWHRFIIIGSSKPPIDYTYLDNSLVGCPDAISRIATGITILGRYMLKTIFPASFSYDYSYNQIPCETLVSPTVWLTIIVTIALLYAAWKYRPSQPIITFGILFFFISIALVTNIFTLIGATMGERLLFTPVLGIILALVFAVYLFTKQLQAKNITHAPLIGIGIIAVVMSIVSINRNMAWASNQTLFTRDAETVKQSARAQFNKGVMLMNALPEDVSLQQPKLPKVIEAFDKALAIDPNELGSHVNIAVCYYRLKQYDKSIEHTRKAMAINPADNTYYSNLADALFMGGQPDSAIVYYNKIINLQATTRNTYNFLGVAWFNKKDYNKASAVFSDGLKVYPDHTEMWMNYGNALAMSKNIPEAIQAFNKALELNPGNRQAFYSLALAYHDLGDEAQSSAYLAKYNGAK